MKKIGLRLGNNEALKVIAGRLKPLTSEHARTKWQHMAAELKPLAQVLLSYTPGSITKKCIGMYQPFPFNLQVFPSPKTLIYFL